MSPIRMRTTCNLLLCVLHHFYNPSRGSAIDSTLHVVNHTILKDQLSPCFESKMEERKYAIRSHSKLMKQTDSLILSASEIESVKDATAHGKREYHQVPEKKEIDRGSVSILTLRTNQTTIPRGLRTNWRGIQQDSISEQVIFHRGALRIIEGLEWNDNFHEKTSSAYLVLEQLMLDVLEESLLRSPWENWYYGVVVEGFRKGSVIVDFTFQLSNDTATNVTIDEWNAMLKFVLQNSSLLSNMTLDVNGTWILGETPDSLITSSIISNHENMSMATEKLQVDQMHMTESTTIVYYTTSQQVMTSLGTTQIAAEENTLTTNSISTVYVTEPSLDISLSSSMVNLATAMSLSTSESIVTTASMANEIGSFTVTTNTVDGINPSTVIKENVTLSSMVFETPTDFSSSVPAFNLDASSVATFGGPATTKSESMEVTVSSENEIDSYTITTDKAGRINLLTTRLVNVTLSTMVLTTATEFSLSVSAFNSNEISFVTEAESDVSSRSEISGGTSGTYTSITSNKMYPTSSSIFVFDPSTEISSLDKTPTIDASGTSSLVSVVIPVSTLLYISDITSLTDSLYGEDTYSDSTNTIYTSSGVGESPITTPATTSDISEPTESPTNALGAYLWATMESNTIGSSIQESNTYGMNASSFFVSEYGTLLYSLSTEASASLEALEIMKWMESSMSLEVSSGIVLSTSELITELNSQASAASAGNAMMSSKLNTDMAPRTESIIATTVNSDLSTIPESMLEYFQSTILTGTVVQTDSSSAVSERDLSSLKTGELSFITELLDTSSSNKIYDITKEFGLTSEISNTETNEMAHTNIANKTDWITSTVSKITTDIDISSEMISGTTPGINVTSGTEVTSLSYVSETVVMKSAFTMTSSGLDYSTKSFETQTSTFGAYTLSEGTLPVTTAEINIMTYSSDLLELSSQSSELGSGFSPVTILSAITNTVSSTTSASEMAKDSSQLKPNITTSIGWHSSIHLPLPTTVSKTTEFSPSLLTSKIPTEHMSIVSVLNTPQGLNSPLHVMSVTTDMTDKSAVISDTVTSMYSVSEIAQTTDKGTLETVATTSEYTKSLNPEINPWTILTSMQIVSSWGESYTVYNTDFLSSVDIITKPSSSSEMSPKGSELGSSTNTEKLHQISSPYESDISKSIDAWETLSTIVDEIGTSPVIPEALWMESTVTTGEQVIETSSNPMSETAEGKHSSSLVSEVITMSDIFSTKYQPYSSTTPEMNEIDSTIHISETIRTATDVVYTSGKKPLIETSTLLVSSTNLLHATVIKTLSSNVSEIADMLSTTVFSTKNDVVIIPVSEIPLSDTLDTTIRIRLSTTISETTPAMSSEKSTESWKVSSMSDTLTKLGLQSDMSEMSTYRMSSIVKTDAAYHGVSNTTNATMSSLDTENEIIWTAHISETATEVHSSKLIDETVEVAIPSVLFETTTEYISLSDTANELSQTTYISAVVTGITGTEGKVPSSNVFETTIVEVSSPTPSNKSNTAFTTSTILGKTLENNYLYLPSSTITGIPYSSTNFKSSSTYLQDTDDGAISITSVAKSKTETIIYTSTGPSLTLESLDNTAFTTTEIPTGILSPSTTLHGVGNYAESRTPFAEMLSEAIFDTITNILLSLETANEKVSTTPVTKITAEMKSSLATLYDNDDGLDSLGSLSGTASGIISDGTTGNKLSSDEFPITFVTSNAISGEIGATEILSEVTTSVDSPNALLVTTAGIGLTSTLARIPTTSNILSNVENKSVSTVTTSQTSREMSSWEITDTLTLTYSKEIDILSSASVIDKYLTTTTGETSSTEIDLSLSYKMPTDIVLSTSILDTAYNTFITTAEFVILMTEKVSSHIVSETPLFSITFQTSREIVPSPTLSYTSNVVVSKRTGSETAAISNPSTLISFASILYSTIPYTENGIDLSTKSSTWSSNNNTLHEGVSNEADNTAIEVSSISTDAGTTNLNDTSSTEMTDTSTTDSSLSTSIGTSEAHHFSSVSSAASSEDETTFTTGAYSSTSTGKDGSTEGYSLSVGMTSISSTTLHGEGLNSSPSTETTTTVVTDTTNVNTVSTNNIDAVTSVLSTAETGSTTEGTASGSVFTTEESVAQSSQAITSKIMENFSSESSEYITTTSVDNSQSVSSSTTAFASNESQNVTGTTAVQKNSTSTDVSLQSDGSTSDGTSVTLSSAPNSEFDTTVTKSTDMNTKSTSIINSEAAEFSTANHMSTNEATDITTMNEGTATKQTTETGTMTTGNGDYKLTTEEHLSSSTVKHVTEQTSQSTTNSQDGPTTVTEQEQTSQSTTNSHDGPTTVTEQEQTSQSTTNSHDGPTTVIEQEQTSQSTTNSHDGPTTVTEQEMPSTTNALPASSGNIDGPTTVTEQEQTSQSTTNSQDGPTTVTEQEQTSQSTTNSHDGPTTVTEQEQTSQSTTNSQDGPTTVTEQEQTSQSTTNSHDGPTTVSEQEQTSQSTTNSHDGPTTVIKQEQTFQSTTNSHDGPATVTEQEQTSQSTTNSQDGPTTVTEQEQTSQSTTNSHDGPTTVTEQEQTSQSTTNSHDGPTTVIEQEQTFQSTTNSHDGPATVTEQEQTSQSTTNSPDGPTTVIEQEQTFQSTTNSHDGPTTVTEQEQTFQSTTNSHDGPTTVTEQEQTSQSTTNSHDGPTTVTEQEMPSTTNALPASSGNIEYTTSTEQNIATTNAFNSSNQTTENDTSLTFVFSTIESTNNDFGDSSSPSNPSNEANANTTTIDENATAEANPGETTNHQTNEQSSTTEETITESTGFSSSSESTIDTTTTSQNGGSTEDTTDVNKSSVVTDPVTAEDGNIHTSTSSILFSHLTGTTATTNEEGEPTDTTVRSGTTVPVGTSSDTTTYSLSSNEMMTTKFSGSENTTFSNDGNSQNYSNVITTENFVNETSTNNQVTFSTLNVTSITMEIKQTSNTLSDFLSQTPLSTSSDLSTVDEISTNSLGPSTSSNVISIGSSTYPTFNTEQFLSSSQDSTETYSYSDSMSASREAISSNTQYFDQTFSSKHYVDETISSSLLTSIATFPDNTKTSDTATFSSTQSLWETISYSVSLSENPDFFSSSAQPSVSSQLLGGSYFSSKTSLETMPSGPTPYFSSKTFSYSTQQFEETFSINTHTSQNSYSANIQQSIETFASTITTPLSISTSDISTIILDTGISSGAQPSMETLSSFSKQSSQEIFSSPQTATELFSSDILYVTDLYSTSSQPIEETSYSSVQFSEEISSSKTQSFEETFSSSSFPSVGSFSSSLLPSEELFSISAQPFSSEEIPSSAQSSNVIFSSNIQSSEGIFSTDTLSLNEKFSSSAQSPGEIFSSSIQLSTDIISSSGSENPSEEIFSSSMLSLHEIFPSNTQSSVIFSSIINTSIATLSISTHPLEETFSSIEQTSEEIYSSNTVYLKETVSSRIYSSSEIFSSSTQFFEETISSSMQSFLQTFYNSIQPSSEVISSSTQSIEETFSSSLLPPEEIFSSNTQFFEVTFSSSLQSSSETFSSGIQPSSENLFSSIKFMDEAFSSSLLPSEEIFSSSIQSFSETFSSSIQSSSEILAISTEFIEEESFSSTLLPSDKQSSSNIESFQTKFSSSMQFFKETLSSSIHPSSKLFSISTLSLEETFSSRTQPSSELLFSSEQLSGEIFSSSSHTYTERFSSSLPPFKDIISSSGQPSEEIFSSSAQSFEETFSLSSHPSIESFSSSLLPSGEIFSNSAQTFYEVFSSSTQSSEEQFSSSRQLFEETFSSNLQPSEEIFSSSTQSFEETFSRSLHPSTATFSSSLLNSEDIFSNSKHSSEEHFSSIIEPSEDIFFSSMHTSAEFFSSSIQPEEIFSSGLQPTEEIFSSSLQHSEDIFFSSIEPAEEMFSSSMQPYEDIFSSSLLPSEKIFFSSLQPSDIITSSIQSFEETFSDSLHPSIEEFSHSVQTSEKVSMFSSDIVNSTIQHIETLFSSSLPSGEIFSSSAHTPNDIFSSSAKPSSEMFSSSVQPSKVIFSSSTEPSEEIFSSNVQPSEEIFSSSVQPSEEMISSSILSLEGRFFSSVHSSEEIFSSSVQSSGEIFSIGVQSSDEMISSSILSFEETFSSSVHTSEELFHSSAKPSDQTFSSSIPLSIETFSSSSQSSEELFSTELFSTRKSSHEIFSSSIISTVSTPTSEMTSSVAINDKTTETASPQTSEVESTTHMISSSTINPTITKSTTTNSAGSGNEHMTSTQMSPTTTDQAVDTQQTVYTGNIKLEEEFNPQLLDKNSELYQQKMAEALAFLMNLFAQTNLAGNLENLVITGFRQGSVIVDFQVVFVDNVYDEQFLTTTLNTAYYSVFDPQYIMLDHYTRFSIQSANASSYENVGITTVSSTLCTSDPCPQFSNCYDVEDNYICQCFTGYKMEGLVCLEIDECLGDVCPLHAYCNNTEGSYTCTCNDGFIMINGLCKDINECENTSPCTNFSKCINADGSYFCVCNQGFKKNNNICEDVDECQGSVCPLHATCNNTVGSFVCTCQGGFQENNGLCNDVNECLLNKCSPDMNCINTLGSFNCLCKFGYAREEDQNCTDIDECTMDVCSAYSTCTNTPGSYYCTCVQGYTDTGEKCIDVNECLAGICPALSSCYNTQGSYVCICNNGFALQDGSCVDVNECLQDVCTAHSNCVNSAGSYECPCNSGYTLNNGVCIDMNECALDTCPDNSECFNTEGSYMCHCHYGYFQTSQQECIDSKVYSLYLRMLKAGNISSYSDNLNNSMTDTFSSLVDLITDTLDQAFNGSNLTYTGTVIRKFLPGSIVADGYIYFDLTSDVDEHGITTELEAQNHVFTANDIYLYNDSISISVECPTADDQSKEISEYRVLYNRNNVKAVYWSSTNIVECNDTAWNDCSKFATCLNTDGKYNCSCIAGYLDISKNTGRPGRFCVAISDDNMDPLSGLHIMVDQQYQLVDTPVMFTVAMDRGSHVSYTIDYGDGKSENKDNPDMLSFRSPVLFSHRFASWGNYSVIVSARNNISSGVISTMIVVVSKIENITVNAIQSDPVYSGIVQFMTESQQMHFQNVYFQWDFGDGEIQNTLISEDRETGVVYVNHTFSVGNYTAKLNVSNERSFQILSINISSEERVTNLTADCNTYITQPSDSIVLNIKTKTGSNLLVNVLYGNDNEKSIFLNNNLRGSSNVYIPINYDNIGKYTVEVVVKNTLSSQHYVLQDLVYVQNPLRDIVLNADAVVPLPHVKFSLSLVYTGDSHPPCHVTCGIYIESEFIKQIYVDVLSSSYIVPIVTYINTTESIGEAKVNMLCLNNISNASLQTWTMLQRTIEGVSIHASAMYIPVYGTITFNFEIGIGSHIQYQYDFGDGVSENDFRGDTLVQNFSVEVDHTFSLKGIYAVTFSVSNLVSSVSKQVTIKVLEEIGGLSVSSHYKVSDNTGMISYGHGPNDVVFPIERRIVFEAGVTSGNYLLYNWDFGDGNTLESQEKTITYQYTKAGSYVVLLNVNNELYHVTQSINITMQHIVQPYTVRNDGPKKAYEIMTFNLKLTLPGTNSCYIWDMGDGAVITIYGTDNCIDKAQLNGYSYVPWKQTTLLQHSHMYQSNGTFRVKITGFNTVSSQSIYDIAVISGVSCFYPLVHIIGGGQRIDKPVSKMRSEWINLESTAEINCDVSDEPEYEWTIAKLFQGTTYLDRIYENYRVSALTTDVFKILFPPRTFLIGQYRISLNVSMKGIPGLFSEHFTFINITSTPLVVKIKGGNLMVVGYDKWFELNAIDVSYDLDEDDQANKTGFTFEWSCRKKNETFTSVLNPITIPSIDAVYNMTRNGGCFGTGVGILPLQSGKFQISSLLLDPHSTNIFQVSVKKGSKIGSFHQTVVVVDGQPPEINIRCKENCKSKMNPSSSFTLKTECLTCSFFDHIEYTWNLYMKNEITDNFEIVQNITEYVTTGLHSSVIVFKPKVLIGGMLYRLRVDVEVYGYTATYTEHEFLTNLPPYGGDCTVAPTSGLALETKFMIQCNGWLNPGEENMLGAGLLYRFWLRPKGGSDIQLLYYGTDPFTPNSTFPLGPKAYDFYNDVVVRVANPIGEFVDKWIKVQVKKPKGEDNVNELISLTSGDNNQLTELLSFGKTQQAKQMIVAVASLINKSPMEIGQSRASMIQPETETNIAATTYKPTTYSTFPNANGTWKIGDNTTLFSEQTTVHDEATTTVAAAATTTSSVETTMDALEKERREKEELEKRKRLRESLLETLSTETDSLTLDAVQQTAMCIRVVTHETSELSEKAQNIAVNAISNLVDSFKQTLKQQTSDTNSNQKYSTAEDVLACLGNVVSAASEAEIAKIKRLNEDESQEGKGNADTSSSLDESDSTQENSNTTSSEGTAQTETEIRKKLKEIAEKVLDVADEVYQTIVKDSVPGEPPIVLESKLMKLVVQRKGVNDISNSILGTTTSSIHMPSFTSVLDKHANTSFIDTQMLDLTTNPYLWDASAKFINSPVVTLNLYDSDGDELAVNDLQDDMIIDIEIDSSGGQKTDISFPVIARESMSFHSFKVRSNLTSVHIILGPEQNETSLECFIKFGQEPSIHDYDMNETIPHSVTDNVTDDILLRELSYSLFLSPEFIQSHGVGRYYIGIRAIHNITDETVYEDYDEYYEDYGDESSVTEYFNYTFTIHTSGCFYWNEGSGEWVSDGCRVSPLSNSRFTRCLCNHLTSFGADFFVPPNKIDFMTVFNDMDAKIRENWAVLAMISTVAFLYIIGVIWARYNDKKDIIKWGVSPLADNVVSDKYFYQVTVCTGMRRGAGTKSSIQFVLAGEIGDTGVRSLTDEKEKKCSRGSVNNFVMSTQDWLGPLSFIRIWHDNSGLGKYQGWYLSRIIVTDLQSNEVFCFFCNRWLAVEEDDGMIDRLLPVASAEDLTSFGNVFATKTKKSFTDSHLWISVFSRPHRSTFTRVQRLSCILSLVMTTMMANAMYYQTDNKEENKESLWIGPIELTLRNIYISIVSSFIVLPVNMIIDIIFRKTKPKTNRITNAFIGKNCQRIAKLSQIKLKTWDETKVFDVTESDYTDSRPQSSDSSTSGRSEELSVSSDAVLIDTKRKEKDPSPKTQAKDKKKFSLPHSCIYVGWSLVFLSSFLSGFITFLYSMEWGKEKSLSWLSSMLLSISESVIVIQPFKIIILAIILSAVFRKPDLEEESNTDDVPSNKLQPNEELLHSHAIKTLRPALKIDPPDQEKLAVARETRLKEIKMHDILREILFYLTFLALIILVAGHNRDSKAYYVKESLVNMIGGTGPLNKVQSIPDVWKWIMKILLPRLYIQSKWNGLPIEEDERRMVVSMVAYRVGPVRIRQQRVKPEECKAVPLMHLYVDTCSLDWSVMMEDSQSYGKSWTQLKINESVQNVKNYPWKHRSLFDDGSIPYVGDFGVYTGGGYIADLIGDRDRARGIAESLVIDDWINRYTRAVFVEFTLYNPYVNMFSTVFVAFELPTTGEVKVKSSIKAFRLFPYLGGYGIFVIFCELVTCASVIYFLVRECRIIRKQKKQYFKSFWNCLELFNLISAMASVIMYILRHFLTMAAVKTVKKLRDKFYNFQKIALWDEIFGYIMGFTVFIAILKLIHLFRFNRRMSMLSGTLRNAMKELSAFSVVFILVLLGFAGWGYMMFGPKLAAYRNMIQSIETLIAFSLGDFDYRALETVSRVFGPIYFFSFFLCVTFILLNVFVTILNESIATIKDDVSKQSNEHEIVSFIWNRFKTWTGLDFDKIFRDVKRKYVYGSVDHDIINFEDQVEDIERKLGDISILLDKIDTNPRPHPKSPWQLKYPPTNQPLFSKLFPTMKRQKLNLD